VLYVIIKPEDKTIIYHLRLHPDTLKALNEISRESIKKDFAMVDSYVIMQQSVDIFKKKMVGLLR